MTRTVIQILRASLKAQLLRVTLSIQDRALTAILQANLVLQLVSIFQPYLGYAETQKTNLFYFSFT